jgi:hypothetical protein
MVDPSAARAPRYFVAEELQAEPDRAARARGCALPLLSGFFVTVAIGMCEPHIALVVLGGH